MPEVSFKRRVRDKMVSASIQYKKTFVDYEYLICSSVFTTHKYYILNGQEDNYQHLTGVNSLISAKEFYDKCINGKLKESDFNFIKTHQSEKSVKGTVRRKINVLDQMTKIFDNNTDLTVQENFIKNRITCSIAATDSNCTLGFINYSSAYPKSLIKGNALDSSKCGQVDLLLSKETNAENFDNILIGSPDNISNYYQIIKALHTNSELVVVMLSQCKVIQVTLKLILCLIPILILRMSEEQTLL